MKIHNLPDHVYFNHSQHTVAGKVQCQTCHGEIQEMDEVKQFTDLSMGWCVNCHRETKVNFVDSAGTKGNKFYSIYEKYHDEIKSGKRDSVTVVTSEELNARNVTINKLLTMLTFLTPLGFRGKKIIYGEQKILAKFSEYNESEQHQQTVGR